MTRYTSIVVPHEMASDGVTFTELEAFLKENGYVPKSDTIESVGIKYEVGEKVTINEIEVR